MVRLCRRAWDQDFSSWHLNKHLIGFCEQAHDQVSPYDPRMSSQIGLCKKNLDQALYIIIPYWHSKKLMIGLCEKANDQVLSSLLRYNITINIYVENMRHYGNK